MTEHRHHLQHLHSAAQTMEKTGLFGLIWLDADLNVTQTWGRLAAFVQRDKPITDSLIALVGLEQEIGALRQSPGQVIELPAVGLMQADADSASKLNFSIMLDAPSNATLILVHRNNAQSEVEVELSRQIRARLMSEAALEQTSKDLRRANIELERFASIISHDLKAPLRHMRHLVDDALQDNAAMLPKSTLAQLTQISEQTMRMTDMLTALFEYSVIDRKFDVMETVDSAMLVQTLVAELPRKNFEFAVSGDWPTFTTLRAPLHLVLLNLISNAISHHDRATGCIRLNCQPSSLALIIQVSDDGPGIDPKHHETIFLPFRTLANPGSQAPSTGMGLASVRRILEAMGGNISVDSQPARTRGTTFTVIWPKSASN